MKPGRAEPASRRPFAVRGLFAAAAAVLSLAACAVDNGRDAPGSSLYAHPQRVAIEGYSDHAMEPFLSRDGRNLFFNNLNHPSVDTNLHVAERIDATRFRYKGELHGANTTALEGVASMDRSGNLYFVSLRDYEKTFSTIFRGKYVDGVVTGVTHVPGISRHQSRYVNFDVDVSPDGDHLYFVDGRFGLLGPQTADIVVAERRGAEFAPLPESADLLRNVNTDALEYAPCISADGRTLLFTRMRARLGARPSIFVARRDSVAEPFRPAEKLVALDGHVEAPTLSVDERSVYYHKKEGDRFVIFMASRSISVDP